MPYSSPQPSSVQWQAQTRIRSAPHSPTLRPRTSPPESVEDLSFPEENPIMLPSVSKAAPPASAPVSAFATIPLVKAPPRPAPQRLQTPGSPPKLPVSNASTTKSRSKERGQASGPPSAWAPGPPEKSKPVSGTTVTLVPNDPQTADDKPLVNGMKQSVVAMDATLTNGVHKPVTNGVSKQLIESLQHVEAASSAPQSQAPQGVETQLATSAARHSDADSAADDLDKAAVITTNPTGSNQTAEGSRKANPLKAFMLRILSCCNRDRF